MTMLLWHLQIRNNQFCFSSRLTSLTSMMSFWKSSRVSVPAFCPQILVSKLLCLRNFAYAQKYVFREARRFYFDYFHVSVHSFTRNRKHYKIIIFLAGWGGGDIDLISSSSTKFTLLAFVIIWPIIYGIWTYFLMS